MPSRLRTGLIFLSLCGAAVASAQSPSVATQFLRHIYGADDVPIETVCWPHNDLWMLKGRANPPGVAAVEAAKITHGRNDIVWENIEMALCIVEVRDGRVDASFNLEQVYFQHRRLVLSFIYAALGQNQEMLADLVTHPKNVKFSPAKPASRGDMGVYEEVLALLPVVRTSGAASDRMTKTVLYRVPLGPRGLTLKVKRVDGAWRIDTSVPLTVPLEALFR